MNLLSLIIIFLALAIVVSICYIAWELTSEKSMPRQAESGPGTSKESKDAPDPGESS